MEVCQENKNTSYSKGMEKSDFALKIPPIMCVCGMLFTLLWRPTAKDTSSEGTTQGAGSTFPWEQFAVGGSIPLFNTCPTLPPGGGEVLPPIPLFTPGGRGVTFKISKPLTHSEKSTHPLLPPPPPGEGRPKTQSLFSDQKISTNQNKPHFWTLL